MEDAELKTITFKVSGEDAESIDKAVRESGLSRSDYIRQCLLNLSSPGKENPPEAPLAENPLALLQQILYVVQRIHMGLYRMPKVIGSLTLEQLQEISADTVGMAVKYMAEVEAALSKTRSDIAAERAARAQASAAAN